MKEKEFIMYSEEDTLAFGKRLGEYLLKNAANSIISLVGPLGAGKTTFVKGVSLGLNALDYVESPTFVFLNIYNGALPLFHYDLYRVNDLKELDDLGIFEMLSRKGVHVIEWGDKVYDLIDFDIEVSIEILSTYTRKFFIKTYGALESVLDEVSFS